MIAAIERPESGVNDSLQTLFLSIKRLPLCLNMLLLSPPLMEVLETIPHRKWVPPSLDAISPLLYSEQANLTT
jgi:hypothetical protein